MDKTTLSPDDLQLLKEVYEDYAYLVFRRYSVNNPNRQLRVDGHIRPLLRLINDNGGNLSETSWTD